MACPVKCATVPRFRVAVPSAHGVRCTNPGLFCSARPSSRQSQRRTNRRLYRTDNSYDDRKRGSRSVHGTGDLLWAVNRRPGMGGPIFTGPARPWRLFYSFSGKPRPPRLLLDPPNVPPPPAAVLDVHASATGFIFHEAPHSGIQAKRSSRCSAINSHIGKSAEPRWISRSCVSMYKPLALRNSR